MSDHDFAAAYLAACGHKQPPVPPPDLHPHPAPAARPLQHAASNSTARKRDDAATCLVCGNSVAVDAAAAWDEGHAAGRDYQGDGWNSDAHDPREDNPYRALGDPR